MDVVDRVSATDRAVAAYRRFVSADNLNVVPDMISDLLHWQRIMLDPNVTVDALSDLLISALEQYSAELERFGIGDDPLTGNRREPTSIWGGSIEPAYTEVTPFDMPIPESPTWMFSDNAEEHPGFDSEANCNCLECMDSRAEARGFIEAAFGWIPRDLAYPPLNEEDDLEF